MCLKLILKLIPLYKDVIDFTVQRLMNIENKNSTNDYLNREMTDQNQN